MPINYERRKVNDDSLVSYGVWAIILVAAIMFYNFYGKDMLIQFHRDRMNEVLTLHQTSSSKVLSPDDFSKAQSSFNFLEKSDSENIKNYEVFIELLYESSNYLQVIEQAQKAIEIDLGNSKVYEILAKAYVKKENYVEAQKYADFAIFYNQNNINAYLISAAIADKQENYFQAKDLYMKIYKLDPNSGEAREKLRKYYEMGL